MHNLKSMNKAVQLIHAFRNITAHFKNAFPYLTGLVKKDL